MGGFYYYGIDSLYIYLVVPAIIIMLWSQIRVKTVFQSTAHIIRRLPERTPRGGA
ncbi:MAG: hypothetical protein ACLR56_02030 [Oscillospiraceae bacterium]